MAERRIPRNSSRVSLLAALFFLNVTGLLARARDFDGSLNHRHQHQDGDRDLIGDSTRFDNMPAPAHHGGHRTRSSGQDALHGTGMAADSAWRSSSGSLPLDPHVVVIPSGIDHHRPSAVVTLAEKQRRQSQMMASWLAGGVSDSQQRGLTSPSLAVTRRLNHYSRAGGDSPLSRGGGGGGRSLMGINSWYWYCNTFDGPVCSTCQLIPQGYDPCMVRSCSMKGRCCIYGKYLS